jgi:hypothetical protein
MHTEFWSENLKGKDQSKDLYLWEIGWEDVDWMHLVQDRDQCRTLVNTVMNLEMS